MGVHKVWRKLVKVLEYAITNWIAIVKLNYVRFLKVAIFIGIGALHDCH